MVGLDMNVLVCGIEVPQQFHRSCTDTGWLMVGMKSRIYRMVVM